MQTPAQLQTPAPVWGRYEFSCSENRSSTWENRSSTWENGSSNYASDLRISTPYPLPAANAAPGVYAEATLCLASDPQFWG